MTLKYILTFIAVIACLAVIVYGLSIYDKHTEIELGLQKEQNEYTRQNDSLKIANMELQADKEKLQKDISDIGKQKETIKQVYTDKTKKDISKPASEQGQILKELINK